MDLLNLFIKDDVPAVGLTGFRDVKKDVYTPENKDFNFNRQIFTANYSKNFFLV